MKKMKYLRTWLVVALVVTIIGSLTGGTVAWFTDSVESTGNIIKSGTLDIKLYAADPDTYTANDFAWANTHEVKNDSPALFTYELWEPGYTEVRYLKIENAGDLALKYQIGINPSSVTTGANDTANLADVIDVYVLDGGTAITRTSLENVEPKSITELMAEGAFAANGVLLPAEGKGSTDVNEDANPRGSVEKVIVLKMQESAGNEYQNCSLSNVGIKLEAAQYMWENDSFDHKYDEDAEYGSSNLPTAKASALPETELTRNYYVVTDWNNLSGTLNNPQDAVTLATGYKFVATETADQAANSPYRYYNADFTVSVNKPLSAGVIGLAGEYTHPLFGFLPIAFNVDEEMIKIVEGDEATVIPAGKEFRLLKDLYPMNYEEVCANVNEFICGAYICPTATDAQKAELAGTTITVKLNLYETIDPSLNGGEPSPEEVEDGKSFTIATYSYTF